MTDVSTRYYDSTFNGLMAQIGLSVGVSVVCLACFEYNRRKKTLDYLYSPRCRLSVDPSPPVSRKLLGWIIPTVKLKEEFYINNVGLDAVMYLRFLRMCFHFCVFNGIVAGGILLPIHYFAGGTLTEVARMSITNVPRDTNLFWAHVFLTYVISLSWMFLLFKNYWQWMDLRREYTLQRIRHGEIAERSIFISRLPSNLRSDAALKQYFESLKMGPVESATVVKDCGRLSQKLDRRDSALNRLEKAHIDLARSVLENVKSGHFPEEAATVIVSDKSHATSSSTTVDYATLQQLVQDLYKDRKHYNKVRKSISAIERALATRGNKDTSMVAADINQPTTAKQILETTATSETVVARHDLDTIDIVVHQEPESIAPFRTGLQEPETSTVITTGRYNDPGKNSIWHILASLRRQDLDAFQPTRTEKRFKSGERVDSIDYFLKKFNRLDRKIEELRDGSLRYKSTSFGFVTFKHHLSAQLCAQSKIDSRPQGLSVRLAMEPRDVLWSNLTVSFRNRFTRTVAVNLSSWALIIFWIFPTSSFLLLMSLTQLSQRFKFLEPILEASPLIQSLIQNVLPIIFVTIFLALAPVIILAISKQELPVSHSELEGKVLQRYYHFLIFNVLFVFMIGSAVVKSIISILQEPTNIFKLLADLLPSGSTFFVFYIIFNTCTHFLELLQVWAQLVIHIFVTAKRLTGTPRSLQRAITPWCFQYYYYYPQNILAFVITLIYSIISPLILLAAVFFFGFALLIFKYQLAYCYIRRYENSGRYFRHVFQYTSDGLIIFNVTMIGVLWLNEAVVGGFLIVVLLGFTIYFKIVCADLFRSRTKYLPLDTGLRNFGPEPDPTGPDTELRSNILSTSVGSTSTRSCASSAASTSGRGGLRKRHIGENAQTAATSVASLGNLTSEGLADLGSSDPVGSSSGSGGSGSSNLGLSQPKTFSRLRPAAGQSDRYEKLMHRDSNDDILDESHLEDIVDEPAKEKKETIAISRDTSKEGRDDIIDKGDDDNADARPQLNMDDDFCDYDNHSGTFATGYEATATAIELTNGGSGPSAEVATSRRNKRATYGDGFLADNNYFSKTVGPSHFLQACTDPAAHFDHSPSKIIYQDQTSEFETYIHPALFKPLNRKMWLPRNPLYEHWDLDDTMEIDFALNSSATEGKLKLRVYEVDGIGIAQSPRFDLRVLCHDTYGPNTGDLSAPTSAVAPLTSASNWEGCLGSPSNLEAAQNSALQKSVASIEGDAMPEEYVRTRTMDATNIIQSQYISSSPQTSSPCSQPISLMSTPVMSPLSVHKALQQSLDQDASSLASFRPRRRMTIPVGQASDSSNVSRKDALTPLSSSGVVTRPRARTPLRSCSHGPSIIEQSTDQDLANSNSLTLPLPGRPLPPAAPLMRRRSTFFPAQNHSGSGAGTVSGSSIHITQPKNARGFLNMIFGGLNHDDDNDDDDGDGRPTGTDKPQFGYETGGAWVSRRHNHTEEDDTDDDEDEDVPKALGSSSANAAVSGTGDGDGNSKDGSGGAIETGPDPLGLEESQKTPSPAANLDLTETLPVPKVRDISRRRSEGIMKRTMSFWRDSDKPDRSGV
ncbi:hypothetical protein BX616_008877 [Lobosporangium transversale]|nr:hypothetical protein BX616_008877 [Lobosporangium transversale]